MNTENMPPFLRSQKAMIKQKIDQIMNNCNRIAVRCRIDNKWESKWLTELPPSLAIQQSLLLLRRVLFEDRIPIYHVDDDKDKSLKEITKDVAWAQQDILSLEDEHVNIPKGSYDVYYCPQCFKSTTVLKDGLPFCEDCGFRWTKDIIVDPINKTISGPSKVVITNNLYRSTLNCEKCGSIKLMDDGKDLESYTCHDCGYHGTNKKKKKSSDS